LGGKSVVVEMESRRKKERKGKRENKETCECVEVEIRSDRKKKEQYDGLQWIKYDTIKRMW
jgi:hypothetical protein